MPRLLISILTILILYACKSNKADYQLSELEKYIEGTDSLTANSKLFDTIAICIFQQHTNFEAVDGIKYYHNDTTGILKEQSFKYHYDSTGHYPNLTYDLKLTEYKTNRQAAIAFWKFIEFQACCIPDEDIARLMNFKNLDSFKNSASTTVLTENILFQVEIGGRDDLNEEISNSLEKLLEKRKYLKLEIGNGGPAVWTIKHAP